MARRGRTGGTAGIGWQRGRPGCGHRRESLRRAMIAADAAVRKCRIPYGQYIADAAGRHPGEALTRAAGRAWTAERAGPIVRLRFVFTGRPRWRLSADELDDRARPPGEGGRTWRC